MAKGQVAASAIKGFRFGAKESRYFGEASAKAVAIALCNTAIIIYNRATFGCAA